MTNLPPLLWPTLSLATQPRASLTFISPPLTTSLSPFSLAQCTSKTNHTFSQPLPAAPSPLLPPWIPPTVPKNTAAVTAAAVADSLKKATSAISLSAPPPHQRKLPLTPPFQSPPQLLVHRRRHVSSTRISAEHCHLMTLTYGVNHRILKSMNRSWICLIQVPGSCRWAACGRFWGGCRRRGCWRQLGCVRAGERQRGGYGGRRRSLDSRFHLGLSLCLLDLCCGGVLDSVDSVLDRKGQGLFSRGFCFFRSTVSWSGSVGDYRHLGFNNENGLNLHDLNKMRWSFERIIKKI